MNVSAGGSGIVGKAYDPFATNSPSFRATVSTTRIPNAGFHPGITVGVYNSNLSGDEAKIASPRINAGDTKSFLIKEGTGLYDISVAGTDTKYTIVVEECTEGSTRTTTGSTTSTTSSTSAGTTTGATGTTTGANTTGGRYHYGRRHKATDGHTLSPGQKANHGDRGNRQRCPPRPR
jgi:hypothetical protein